MTNSVFESFIFKNELFIQSLILVVNSVNSFKAETSFAGEKLF